MLKMKERRFHQGPRGIPQHEAGYMRAVFSENHYDKLLRFGPGPYMPSIKLDHT